MRITAGHILLCLISIAELTVSAPIAGPSENLKPGWTKDLSYRQPLGKVKGGRVGKYTTTTKLKGLNKAKDTRIGPGKGHDDSNEDEDIIVLSFTESTDTDYYDSEPDAASGHVSQGRPTTSSREAPPNLNSIPSFPPPQVVGIDPELRLIFHWFRTEILHIHRPFRLKYYNTLNLDYEYTLQSNEHHVYFWGQGLTNACTRNNVNCQLKFAQPQLHDQREDLDHHDRCLATVKIKESEQRTSEWAVPFSIREQILQQFEPFGNGIA
ncbi:hypothetical protein C8R42DRAFT_291477 [Lentinula raphanica]|nr:hypothetical protein C8R42DRAFT_291477 [Lentinula raphanica]